MAIATGQICCIQIAQIELNWHHIFLMIEVEKKADLMKKQEDSSWKIAVAIYNRNTPRDN